MDRFVGCEKMNLSLFEYIQGLPRTFKSCRLRLKAASAAGEIHFADGKIVHAEWGDTQGEEAFYAMLLQLQDVIEKYEPQIDKDFSSTIRTITRDFDTLIVEGLFRLEPLPNP